MRRRSRDSLAGCIVFSLAGSLAVRDTSRSSALRGLCANAVNVTSGKLRCTFIDLVPVFAGHKKGQLPYAPAQAGLVGWLVGMVTRQSGHLFFEPRGYDAVHQTSYEHKESIKVGYNMRRKAVLIGCWLALPLLLLAFPCVFGVFQPARDRAEFLHQLGLVWLALGAGGLAFRTLHLFVLRSPSWGLAWACKIITDPFHNIAQYWRSPLALMLGQRLDPLDAAPAR